MLNILSRYLDHFLKSNMINSSFTAEMFLIPKVDFILKCLPYFRVLQIYLLCCRWCVLAYMPFILQVSLLLWAFLFFRIYLSCQRVDLLNCYLYLFYFYACLLCLPSVFSCLSAISTFRFSSDFYAQYHLLALSTLSFPLLLELYLASSSF